MTATFGLYTNAALTIPFTPPLVANQNADGSTGPQDFVLYLGSTATGRTLHAQSNPGVDQITLTVVDAAPSTGEPATVVKLATTQGGLGSGGQTLNLGTAVSSGVGNALPIWVRITDSLHVVGSYTDLSLYTNNLQES